MIRKNSRGDLPQISVAASEFSEEVARTNNEFVMGYKRIQNEF